ncbi:TPA: type II toxin-antitoxin system HigB family toxin [Pseudomonas putida]|nr:type II toxin-antitoxin system HigB family toxin [Pseudomonas putida]HDS1806236.1 type II toxin-antitoxin system HigB family toxin [Pseudomonas putida]
MSGSQTISTLCWGAATTQCGSRKTNARHIACLNARTGTLYIKAILSHAEYDKWCRSDIR